MSTRRKTSVNLLIAVLGTALFTQSSLADPINWRTNLDAAKIEAAQSGKLVLLHFYTSSCGPCKKLERDVFSQPQIAVAMEKDFVPVKLDADKSSALANAFQINRVPTEVVLSEGKVLQKLSCPLEPAAYGAQLANVAQHYRGRSGSRTISLQGPVHSAYAGLKIGPQNQPQAVAAAPRANRTPVQPAITTNPYVATAKPAAPAPTTTAKVTPSRYGNRYAAVMPQAPAVAPATEQPSITPTRTALPVASPAIAAVLDTQPAASAPRIAKVTEKAASPITPTPSTPPSTEQVAVVAPTAKVKTLTEAWPPELPAGTPPLAFDGYCPVSLQKAQKWVRGHKTYGAIHRGRTYLFAGDTERQKFLATPDAFSPVFSGNDPVKMLDENEKVAGARKFGFSYRGAFYLFSSNETMERFARNPNHYSAGVFQAMTRMDASGGGTIRR